MLIPCIDLQEGRAVQLVRGRRLELAVDDVFGLLERFRKHRWLHVIDLDAAMGRGNNDELVRELCRRAKREYRMKVRVGGGIRSAARAKTLIRSGAEQVIIGSAAFHRGRVNARFLRRLAGCVRRKRIVIALDTKKGKVAVGGWRSTLSLKPQEVMNELEPHCGAFLCTDVDREGTMSGANLKYFAELHAATQHPILAAGGIKTRREIAALERLGMDAAVGMAVYKNRLR